MRRMRLRARFIVLGLAALGGLFATVAVGQREQAVPTHSHPDMLLTTLLWMIGGGVAIVGAVSSVTAYILHTRRELFRAEMEAIAQEKVEAHNQGRDAHPVASRANHGPMEDKIEMGFTIISRIDRELGVLLEEHVGLHECGFAPPSEQAEGARSRIRELLEKRANRDPLDSPRLRRATDKSGDDYRPMRGKVEGQ